VVEGDLEVPPYGVSQCDSSAPAPHPAWVWRHVADENNDDTANVLRHSIL
jgi:hypothetical protein